MADACCSPPPLNLDRHRGNKSYRRVLWAVLAINAVMFLIEIGAGLAAGSASLQADALDFLGDADPAARPAPISIKNMTALMASTAHSTRR